MKDEFIEVREEMKDRIQLAWVWMGAAIMTGFIYALVIAVNALNHPDEGLRYAILTLIMCWIVPSNICNLVRQIKTLKEIIKKIDIKIKDASAMEKLNARLSE